MPLKLPGARNKLSYGVNEFRHRLLLVLRAGGIMAVIRFYSFLVSIALFTWFFSSFSFSDENSLLIKLVGSTKAIKQNSYAKFNDYGVYFL